MRQPV